jgi:hypothetical protein
LYKQVKNLAFVVDRAPQPKGPVRDHTPSHRKTIASAAEGVGGEVPGEQQSKLQDPSPHRFVADIRPTQRSVLDVAISERERTYNQTTYLIIAD